MLNPDIQLFAEPVEPAPAVPPAPAGKTFSEEYVAALRGESAGYRTKAKTYEAALRKAFSLKEGEELGDIDARLTSFHQARQKQMEDALSAANQRLIRAELRALEGYDHKLLSKVIDLSGVKVDDAGTVAGIQEAAEAAAKEFPAVKKGCERYAPQNPPPGQAPEISKEQFESMTYAEKLALKQKQPETYKKFIGGNA